MKYRIEVKGFEGQVIEAESPGIFAGAQLLVNGQPAEKGPKRGQMLLKKNNGKEVIASWQASALGFDFPKLVVDGKTIEIVEPLKWYQMLSSGLPVLLVFAGGALGAFLGLIAFSINTQVFRSKLSPVLKYLAIAGISAITVVLFFVLAVLLDSAVR